MAHNVLDIYNEIEQLIKAEYPSYTFENYIGQFENGGEWNPTFPCILIDFEELNPDIKASNNMSIKPYSNWSLYIGVKNTLGLDITQSLFDRLNNANITVSGSSYTISVQPLRKFNKQKSARAYILPLKIQ